MKITKSILFLSLLISLVLGGLILYLFYLKPKPSGIEKPEIKIFLPRTDIDYVIPGVPLISIFNHKGDYGYFSDEVASTLSMVLEYWNPGKNNFPKINNYFYLLLIKKQKPWIKLNDLVGFLYSFYPDIYDVKIENLSLGELKKYINPEVKTPLILHLPFDSQQKINFFPFTLLIGIKGSEKKLIFHDFYLGNNYEVSFSEFEKLQQRLSENLRNRYLVIQPKNLEKKLREKETSTVKPYPERTLIMKEAEGMIKNLTIGEALLLRNNFKEAINYSNEVISDTKFEDFLPPYLKVLVLSNISQAYLNLNDLNKAKNYAEKSLIINKELDKPFKDWPGFEARYYDVINKIPIPYYVLGEVYFRLKDYKKAKEYYLEALKIDSDNIFALNGLKQVELELKK